MDRSNHRPHEAGLAAVAALCAVASALLFARGERAPDWVFMGALALGSAVVSLARRSSVGRTTRARREPSNMPTAA